MWSMQRMQPNHAAWSRTQHNSAEDSTTEVNKKTVKVAGTTDAPSHHALEVMDIQGHTPFKARGGLGVAGYGLDMV
jgi:hypothetical protein